MVDASQFTNFDVNAATEIAKKMGQVDVKGGFIDLIINTVQNWFGSMMELFKISILAIVILIIEIWAVKYILGKLLNIEAEGIAWWVISGVIVFAFVFPLSASLILGAIGGIK